MRTDTVKLTIEMTLYDDGAVVYDNVRFGPKTAVSQFLLQAYREQLKRLRLEREEMIEKLLSYCTTTNRRELEEHLATVEENELANVDDVIKSYIKFFEDKGPW